jgi:8-oxo-dGTP pyrophosphatase MutT (NUDIX family)
MSKTGSNRAAMALICDDNGNVMMGIRNDNGRYTMPGGHLENGEDPFIGMARELKEETGLDAKKMCIARVTKKEKMLVYVIKVEVDPGQPIDTSGDPDHECDTWFYIDPNEVVEELHVPIEENTVLHAWIEQD